MPAYNANTTLTGAVRLRYRLNRGRRAPLTRPGISSRSDPWKLAWKTPVSGVRHPSTCGTSEGRGVPREEGEG